MCSMPKGGLTANVRSSILLRMVRTRVRRTRLVLTAAVIVSLVLGFLAGRAFAEPSAGEAGRPVYVVRPGDTLWEIAMRVAGPEGDPRPVVVDLVSRNGVRDGLIAPGQRLVLPVPPG